MTSEGISVVVCSRDRPQQLEQALPAILAVLRPGDELVVVDSASRTSGTTTVAEAMGVRHVEVSEPGLARARNAGIEASRNPLVAFTDDDCLPDPGWLDAVDQEFRDPRVGLVTGRVRSNRPATFSNSTLDLPQRRVVAGAVDPHRLGHGANMAFRRSALDAIGRFDERLGAGSKLRSAEDVDAFFRMLEAGWRLVYEPAASVLHNELREGASLGLRYGYGLGNGAFRTKVLVREPRLGARLLLRSLVKDGLIPLIRMVKQRNWVQVRRVGAWVGGMLVGIFTQLRADRFGTRRSST